MFVCMTTTAVHVDHRGAQLSCNGLTTRACVLLGLREAGAALQKVNARVRHFGTVFTFLVVKQSTCVVNSVTVGESEC